MAGLGPCLAFGHYANPLGQGLFQHHALPVAQGVPGSEHRGQALFQGPEGSHVGLEAGHGGVALLQFPGQSNELLSPRAAGQPDRALRLVPGQSAPPADSGSAARPVLFPGLGGDHEDPVRPFQPVQKLGALPGADGQGKGTKSSLPRRGLLDVELIEVQGHGVGQAQIDHALRFGWQGRAALGQGVAQLLNAAALGHKLLFLEAEADDVILGGAQPGLNVFALGRIGHGVRGHQTIPNQQGFFMALRAAAQLRQLFLPRGQKTQFLKRAFPLVPGLDDIDGRGDLAAQNLRSPGQVGLEASPGFHVLGQLVFLPGHLLPFHQKFCALGSAGSDLLRGDAVFLREARLLGENGLKTLVRQGQILACGHVFLVPAQLGVQGRLLFLQQVALGGNPGFLLLQPGQRRLLRGEFLLGLFLLRSQPALLLPQGLDTSRRDRQVGGQALPARAVQRKAQFLKLEPRLPEADQALEAFFHAAPIVHQLFHVAEIHLPGGRRAEHVLQKRLQVRQARLRDLPPQPGETLLLAGPHERDGQDALLVQERVVIIHALKGQVVGRGVGLQDPARQDLEIRGDGAGLGVEEQAFLKRHAAQHEGREVELLAAGAHGQTHAHGRDLLVPGDADGRPGHALAQLADDGAVVLARGHVHGNVLLVAEDHGLDGVQERGLAHAVVAGQDCQASVQGNQAAGEKLIPDQEQLPGPDRIRAEKRQVHSSSAASSLSSLSGSVSNPAHRVLTTPSRSVASLP